MPYLRTHEARARLPFGARTTEAAQSMLTKSAAASAGKTFKVFLSHSSSDATLIAGVAEYLKAQGLTVYVDWMEDSQLDRSRVTARTANLLRQRMRASEQLVYVSTPSAPDSKWMPWELGYFDGLKAGRVAILPLVESHDNEFKGQEYLGLYPKIEALSSGPSGKALFVTEGLGSRRFMKMSEFGQGKKEYSPY